MQCEVTWTSGSSCQESSQSEYDGPLVLLDHLDAPDEGEGESYEDEEEGAECEEDGTEVRPLTANHRLLLPAPAHPPLGGAGEVDNVHLPFNINSDKSNTTHGRVRSPTIKALCTTPPSQTVWNAQTFIKCFFVHDIIGMECVHD